MIEAQNLSRRYGDFTAVDGISFAVDDHEILGMLGPNGAGKTTNLRMITGFLPPTRGRVTVFGKDLFEAPREARREIGYLPENVALYPEMRLEESLRERWVGNPTLRVTVKGAPEGVAETLGALPGALTVRPGTEPGAWVVESERSADLREEVFRAAVARSWVLLELAAQKASLEDIFV